MRTGRPRTTLPEQNIIDDYLKGEGSPTLGKRYGISPETIRNILNRNGIPRRSKSDNGRLSSNFDIDESVFDTIDSHEKAYWLGFLITDGNIYNGTISLHLAIKDIEHLYLFRTFMKSNHLVHEIHRTHDSCRIRFKSQKLCTSLAKHGIVPNKSFVTEFAKNIPKEFLSSYVLGILDGDGCFRINKACNTLMFTITSASSDFIRELQALLISECFLNKTKISKYKNKHTLIYAGTKQIFRICCFIYQTNTSHLARKKKIAIDHIKKMGYGPLP
jgi:hypothetical protein